jgi:hypothetical protein
MLLSSLILAFGLAAQVQACNNEAEGCLFVAQMDPKFLECAIKATQEPDTSDCNTQNPGVYFLTVADDTFCSCKLVSQLAKCVKPLCSEIEDHCISQYIIDQMVLVDPDVHGGIFVFNIKAHLTCDDPFKSSGNDRVPPTSSKETKQSTMQTKPIPEIIAPVPDNSIVLVVELIHTTSTSTSTENMETNEIKVSDASENSASSNYSPILSIIISYFILH